MSSTEVQGIPQRPRLSPHPASSWEKRALDVFVALTMLIAFAPFLLLVAVIIRFDSSGPVLFRQRRGGLNGQPFMIYKFRTMRVLEDGEDVTHCARDDDRVTRLGGFLRKSSIDELPQLINVLLGDMSLVGPRPHALAHDEMYGALLPEYLQRSSAKPGLTGLSQISGLRGDIGHLDNMRARIACDISYIRNWSFGLDLRLIYVTAMRVLFDGTAY
jgi:putative colanic acid biosynthesis UDP-glucose lipid carrier transferase